MRRGERSREHMSVDEYIESAHAREKIWNYLNRLGDEAGFCKRIRQLRKKYGLPTNGLKEIKYVKGSKGELLRMYMTRKRRSYVENNVTLAFN